MALKVRTFAVTVGTAQQIELAQGEDCEFIFAFTEPAPPLSTGAPVNLTGLTAATMTVRDANGALVFARSCAGLGASAWAALTAYLVGARVTNGGSIYVCTVAGVSAGAGGPAGTGGAIVDGGVTWKFAGIVPSADPTTGVLGFIVHKADTWTLAPQPYRVDVTWDDATPDRAQLLVASVFLVLPSMSQAGDVITP